MIAQSQRELSAGGRKKKATHVGIEQSMSECPLKALHILRVKKRKIESMESEQIRKTHTSILTCRREALYMSLSQYTLALFNPPPPLMISMPVFFILPKKKGLLR